MAAACHGHLETVKLLLEQNADISMRNKDGYTALILASRNEHFEIINLINQ